MPKRASHPPQQDDVETIPDDLQSLVGRNLRALRRAQNLTQEALGEKVGLGKQYVGRVEDGQINLTLATMKRLATALDVEVVALLDSHGSEQNGPNS